jgi:hypothetical protein
MLNEEDMFDDLAFDEAEGPTSSFDEFDEMDEGDEFDEMDQGDEFDEGDEGDEGDEFDEMADAGDEFDEGDYDEGDDDTDAFVSMVARALQAEDSDEFLRRLASGAMNIGRRVASAARQAAPHIGRAARAAAPLLRAIPHPWAQAGGQIAGLLGRLRADGASEEEALDAMSELAVRNPRALPVVAGLAVRSVARGATARMPQRARVAAVRGVTRTAQNLVRQQGRQAVRAVPRVATSVRRTAATRGTPAQARPQVLRRTVQRVAQNPSMAQRLSRPSPAGQSALRRAGVQPVGRGLGGSPCPRGGRRTITVRGPARITIRRI